MTDKRNKIPGLTDIQSELLYALTERVRAQEFLAGSTKDGPFIIPSATGTGLSPSELPSFGITDLHTLADQKYLTMIPTRRGTFQCSLTDKAMSSKTTAPAGSDVFIVCGRERTFADSVARFIEKLGPSTCILDEQPGGSRTIIEMIEKHCNVKFAVVLLTGDDLGRLKTDPPDQLKPRARQNVIVELGFFLSRLGRDYVCSLYEPGTEIPSDYHGVHYIEIDKGGAWKSKLARELQAAKLPIDLSKAL